MVVGVWATVVLMGESARCRRGGRLCLWLRGRALRVICCKVPAPNSRRKGGCSLAGKAWS